MFTSRAAAARLVALGVAVMALVGCVARAGPAEQCMFNTECAEGLVCAGRVCRVQCREDRDCPGAGERCIASGVRDKTACYRPGEPQNCVYNSDCPPGPTVCLANECRAQCREDRDCPAGTRCRADQVCEAPLVVTANPDAGDGPEAGADATLDAAEDAPTDALADVATDVPPDSGLACPADMPVRPDGMHDAIDVQVGQGFTCALRADRSLWCWGSNASMTLGDRSYTGRFSFAPRRVRLASATANENVEHYSIGRSSGCAAVYGAGLTSGPTTAYCWGLVTNDGTPGPVPRFDNARISVGSNSACALRADRSIWCVGDNREGQLGPNATMPTHSAAVAGPTFTNTTEIAAAQNAFCALHDGGVSCWGWNGYGLLGRPLMMPEFSPTPVPIEGLGPREGIAHIFANGGTGCALLTSGEVRCWGSNAGRIISPDESGNPLRTAVVVPDFRGASTLGIGATHACAVLPNGVLSCRGSNDSGELGIGTRGGALEAITVPVTNVRRVSAYGHTCVVREDRSVWCWGVNSDGELGRGASDAYHTEYRERPTLRSARSVTTGFDGNGPFLCAVDTSNGVWCEGDNSLGQLGRTTPSDGAGGYPIARVDGLPAVSTARAAGRHVCALTTDRRVFCWGDNWAGQAGTAPSRSASPGAVPGVTDATAVAVGVDHSCALLAGGTVKCWGSNANGELAMPAVMMRSEAPVDISGLTGVTALEAGERHTCALLRDGTVKCWGHNDQSQCGAASSEAVRAPNAVPSLTGAVEISVGTQHGCARVSGNAVRCWGGGTWELGAGSPYDHAMTPVPVARAAGATRLHAGWNFNCALVPAQGTLCWGFNRAGELGQPDGQSLATPTDARVPPELRESEASCPTCPLRCAVHRDSHALWCVGWGPGMGTGDDGRFIRWSPAPVCGF